MHTCIPQWDEYNDNDDAKMICEQNSGFVKCSVTPPFDLYIPLVQEKKTVNTYLVHMKKTNKF